MTLIAEDLLLLLLDENSGRIRLDSTRLDRMLAGAVLTELALAERVVPDRSDLPPRRIRLVVQNPAPTGDPILDEALARLTAWRGPVRPQRAVEKLARGLRRQLLARLVGGGLLREQPRAVLGIFPGTGYAVQRPAPDGTDPRGVLQDEVRRVLVQGSQPSPRLAAVIALLSAVDAVTKVVPGADRREVRRRAKQIAAGDWGAAAVRQAVTAVQAAVMAAITATVVTTTTG